MAKQAIGTFLLADIETTVLEKEMEFKAGDLLKKMSKAERKAFNLGRMFQEKIDIAIYEAYHGKKPEVRQ